MLPTLLIVVIAIVVPLFFVFVFGISGYNKLVALRNGYKNGFAQIDVQLKRRYDLIPNLVETAKGYLKHERQTLEAVIVARNQASTAAQRAAAAPATRQPCGNWRGLRLPSGEPWAACSRWRKRTRI